jgi:uncharacterized protein
MTNVEIIKELYRAFAAKDYDAFRRICHEDLEWIQNPGFPHGGHHRGAEEVIANVFQRFNTEWSEWRYVIEEYLDAGASVVVLGYYEGKHRESGRQFHSDAAHVYDLRGGRVARFRQFADTKVIWEALGE